MSRLAVAPFRRRRRETALGPAPPRLGALLLLAVCGLATGCAPAPVETPPRLVILYLPCTVNRAFLGPYNPAVDYTPHLDRWSRRAVVLERHQTEAGQSGTAYASLLSGSRTRHHGVFINGTILRDSVALVGEILAPQGYEVFAWLNHGIGAQFNYAQGVPPENLSSDLLQPTAPRFEQILARLAAEPDYRALVIANFTVTHGPYSVEHVDEFCVAYPRHCAALGDGERFAADHALYSERRNYRTLSWDFPNTAPRLGLAGERLQEFAAHLELAYKSNVFHLDRLFGGLVDAVDGAGLIDDSLIVLTADHGEILYRDNAHFQWTHGLQLAPEVLSVPALFLAPGRLEPSRYPGVTRAIDVVPTVASLAGAAAPVGEDFGRDLTAALRGDVAPPDLQAFSHSTLVGPAEATPNDVYKLQMFHGEDPRFLWVAVRDGDRFYQRLSLDGENFETRAFDLATDPELRRDLFDGGDQRDRRLEEALVRYRNELIRAFHALRRQETAAEEESRLQMLRSLGYID